MKRLIFILAVIFCSCEKENVIPKPIEVKEKEGDTLTHVYTWSSYKTCNNEGKCYDMTRGVKAIVTDSTFTFKQSEQIQSTYDYVLRDSTLFLEFGEYAIYTKDSLYYYNRDGVITFVR